MRGVQAKILRGRSGGRRALMLERIHGRPWLSEDTRKVIGWRFPKAWHSVHPAVLGERLARLLAAGGPWAAEAGESVYPRYAQRVVNTPGSARARYRELKRLYKRGGK